MKKFFSLFAALLFAGSMMAADVVKVTLDFTSNTAWQFPVGSGNGATAAATFSDGTYTIGLAASTKYYFNNDGYLMLGKSGSTLTLPAFDFKTTKIVVTGRSGASTSTKQNIFVGETAVSTETTGATGVNEYAIAADYQAAGNVYVFKVTSAHNAQITKIEVYSEGEGGDPVVGPTVLQAVSDSTTWDFSKITANTANALYSNDGIKLTDESEPSKNDEVIYADYSADFMTIGEDFNKAAIAFKGEYPIRKNQYCQAGTLHFKADVAGTIVVKFSDTGSSASATAVKRYLVVNGVQTEYWTSRENNGETPYDAQLNVVSGKIEVPAGDVTITGSSAITMYYVTFVPEEQEEPELPVYTCAQVQANEATVEGVLNEVTVMFVNGSNVFVKDETGMTQVYLKSNGLAIGNKVSGIKGASTLYKSTPEFVPTNAPADWTVVAGETPVYDEKETIATTADVNGVYVFKNVTFAEATEFTTAAQVNATVTIGEESIVLRNNYKFAYSFAADQAYDVKAVVVIYNNAAQLYFISAEEHISTAIDNTNIDAKVVKFFENGQLVIIKNGVRYNAQGAVVR